MMDIDEIIRFDIISEYSKGDTCIKGIHHPKKVLGHLWLPLLCLLLQWFLVKHCQLAFAY